jgi:nucleotide-binding universal stress UspA family protein
MKPAQARRGRAIVHAGGSALSANQVRKRCVRFQPREQIARVCIRLTVFPVARETARIFQVLSGMDMIKILVPTDFSFDSLAAIAPARAMARKFGAQVDLVYVFDDPLLLADAAANETQTLRERMRRKASDKMQTLLSEVRRDGVEVTGQIVFGSPWRALTEMLGREHYDLAVISTRGREGLERLMLGSVTEQLVRHSPCPVLVIHPDWEGKAETSSEERSITAAPQY